MTSLLWQFIFTNFSNFRYLVYHFFSFASKNKRKIVLLISRKKSAIKFIAFDTGIIYVLFPRHRRSFSSSPNFHCHCQMHRINPRSTRKKKRKKKRKKLNFQKTFNFLPSTNYPNTQPNIFSTLDSNTPPKKHHYYSENIRKRSLEITRNAEKQSLLLPYLWPGPRNSAMVRDCAWEELIKRFGEVDVARVSRWTVNDPHTRTHLSLNNRGAYTFVRRFRLLEIQAERRLWHRRSSLTSRRSNPRAC